MIDVIIQGNDHAVVKGLLHAAGVGAPIVFDDVGQLPGGDQQVKLLGFLARGRGLENHIDAGGFLHQLPAQVVIPAGDDRSVGDGRPVGQRHLFLGGQGVGQAQAQQQAQSQQHRSNPFHRVIPPLILMRVVALLMAVL